ncbi:MAG: DUF1513 domain-containing protein [Hyphomicrobiaceae bacterium]
MEIDRRALLAGIAAQLSTAGWRPPALAAANQSILAANVRTANKEFAAVLYSIERGILRQVALPGRGHDIAVSSATGACVSFARRPGNFAVAFSTDNSQPPTLLSTPANRHFYGHGVFSPDGRLLYTTENDFEGSRGCIGIWDATDEYHRIGELPSYGVGPHDINLLQDGRTLVVANGGIVTHPDFGRRPMNLSSMEPSIVYVDSQTGDLMESQKLPPELHKLSIRHLEMAARDTVVFGCQQKGPKSAKVGLIGFHRLGQDLQLNDYDPNVARALRHYVSSIAVDRSGETAAFTSSRGQKAVIIDVSTRKLRAIHSHADASGVASSAQPHAFVVTGGSGDVAVLSTNGRKRRLPRRHTWNWDNHAVHLHRQVYNP